MACLFLRIRLSTEQEDKGKVLAAEGKQIRVRSFRAVSVSIQSHVYSAWTRWRRWRIREGNSCLRKNSSGLVPEKETS